jgi:hypothetical protein
MSSCWGPNRILGGANTSKIRIQMLLYKSRTLSVYEISDFTIRFTMLMTRYIYLAILPFGLIIQHRMVGWLMYNELERMRKEAAMNSIMASAWRDWGKPNTSTNMTGLRGVTNMGQEFRPFNCNVGWTLFQILTIQNTHPQNFLHLRLQNKKHSGALVRQRTIPIERPPLVGEVSANFSG